MSFITYIRWAWWPTTLMIVFMGLMMTAICFSIIIPSRTKTDTRRT